MRRTLPGIAAFALLLAALLIPAAAGAAPGGGNSPAAKACQKGGYTGLVRADGTAFASEEACVSYAAQGGTLLPRPAITAIRAVIWTLDGVQFVVVAGTNFRPWTRITFAVAGENVLADYLNNGPPYVTTDETGTFDSIDDAARTSILLPCTGGTLTVTASDGTATATATATIPVCPPIE